MMKLQHISKAYGKQLILKNIDVEVPSGQTLTVLGRSGCGKTTLLKIIAGLTAPDNGQIILNGKTMNQVPVHQRHAIYLYQEPLLFPHLNVADNLAYGLRIQKLPESDVKERCKAMLQALDLADQSQKMPGEISGGQRQRVSFGRAMLIQPSVLLLDEPFGNLDAETRGHMQQLFKNLVHQYHITTMFVTHDVKEAVLLGDQCAYMENGVLTTYTSKSDFLNDARTGGKQEWEFWQQYNQWR